MSRKFLTNIDLNTNQLLNGVIQNLASDPGSPAAGQIWYNTTSGLMKWENGSTAIDPLNRTNHSGTQTASTISNLATTVQAYTLNTFAAPVANVSMGGYLINNLGTPSASTDAANKGYVDTAVAGLSWKEAVACATTANITLSGEQTIDGVTTSASRVLVKNQTTTNQNGIYVSGSGAWTRSTDCTSSTQFNGATVYVQAGTTLVDTGWVQTAVNPTVGTTAIAFVQFSGTGSYSAGTGISLTGNVFANTGVLSNVAGTNISVSGATGNVTISVTGTVPTATTATNIAAGSANQIPYQTGAGATAFYSSANYGVQTYTSAGVPSSVAGAAGVLQGSASAIPAFTTTPTLTGTNFTGIPNGALTNSSLTLGSTSMALGSTTTTVAGLTSVTSTGFTGALTGNASTATSIAGGTANYIVYQSASGTTGFITPTANTGYVLTSNGTGAAPTFQASAGGSPTITAVSGTGPYYIAGTLSTSGSLSAADVVSTVSFNASTGALSATSFSGAGTGLTGTAASLTAGLATAVAGGAGGEVVFQTGAGATGFTAAGTAGQVLTSQGTGTPTWTGTAMGKYALTFGDGSSTSYTITHNLGSTDVNVAVYVVSGGAEVECDVTHTSTTVVTLGFSVAPATNTLRVVCIG